MTTEVIAQTLTAGLQATFGQGCQWYLKSCVGPLTIKAESAGGGTKIRKFSNITAGFKFSAAPDDGWTYLRVLSATTQAIEIVVGDDDVEFANAVSIVGTPAVTIAGTPTVTVTGTVATAASVASTLGATADSVIANNAALVVAANAGRARITVGSLSSNTGSVRLQATGAGAGFGLELQPGMFTELRYGGAFDVRNDSGASQTIWRLEES